MESFIFARNMKGPVRFEVAAEIHSPQLQHRFGHRWSPAHPRPFHPILDQVLTGAFHHASRDRPPLSHVRIVAHVVAIPVQVTRHRLHHLALLAPETALCGT